MAKTIAQLKTIKVQVKKHFAFEEGLKEKLEQMNGLNMELDLDKKTCCVDVELEQIEKRFERKCANRER